MRSVEILGCRVDAVSTSDAVETMLALARDPAPDVPRVVVTLGTEMVVRAQHDPDFRALVGGAALSLCDTIGIDLAARVKGVRLPERITGVDLLDPLCTALAREGLGVYLLGSKGETAARAGEALSAKHPDLRVCGARDGYFEESQSGAVAQAIARSGARVVLAGLGSPRQERWIVEHLRATGAGVGIGVGGSMDVLAGNVERAPAAFRRLGLEWFYRLLREPSRFRRQLALPAFVWLVLADRARTLFRSS